MFGINDPNYNPKAVKLVSGFYSFGPEHKVLPSSCTDDVTHSISIAKNSDGSQMVAFGDLNGDGSNDAVVVLNLVYQENNMQGPYDYCKPGGTSSYINSIPMMIVLSDENGKIIQSDQYRLDGQNGFKIDNLQNFKIQDKIIVLSGNSAQAQYKLVNNKLVKVGSAFTVINPPADWKTYKNDDLGITFKYKDGVKLIINSTPQQEQNYFSISVNNNDFAKCVAGPDIPTEEIINQVSFYKTGESDAAMGTYYTQITYATVKNNKCYVITLQYFTHNCENYLPLETGNTQQSASYNQCIADNKSATGLEDVLDGIISTFKFIK